MPFIPCPADITSSKSIIDTLKQCVKSFQRQQQSRRKNDVIFCEQISHIDLVPCSDLVFFSIAKTIVKE